MVDMRRWSYLVGVAAISLSTLVGSAMAANTDPFQGAWGAAGMPCDKIFTHADGHTKFISYLGTHAGGFIVDGDRIHGAHMTCKLFSRKKQGDLYKIVLGCHEEIIFDKVVVTLRFIDKDNLVRFDPDFPAIETRYHRCSR